MSRLVNPVGNIGLSRLESSSSWSPTLTVTRSPSGLTTHLYGLLVVAQAAPRGMAHPTVGGPFAEADLPHQLGLGPHGHVGISTRNGGHERIVVRRQGLEPLGEI